MELRPPWPGSRQPRTCLLSRQHDACPRRRRRPLAGVYFESINLDGQSVPVLAMNPGTTVTPSMLSGHPLASPSQIVLAPATLSALHAHLGGTVIADTDTDGHVPASASSGRQRCPRSADRGTPAWPWGPGRSCPRRCSRPRTSMSRADRDQGPQRGVHLGPARGQRRHHATFAQPHHSGAQPPVRSRRAHRWRSRRAPPAESRTTAAWGRRRRCSQPSWPPGRWQALGLTLVASVRQRRRQFAVLKALGFPSGSLPPPWRGSPRWPPSSGSSSGSQSASPSDGGCGPCSPTGSRPCPTPPCPSPPLRRSPWGPSSSPIWSRSSPGPRRRPHPTSLLLRAE